MQTLSHADMLFATARNHQFRNHSVGELANMICGNARKRLGEEGIPFQAGIPTVVTGRRHTIKHINNGPRLAIPFETPNGEFTVEVVLGQDKYRLNQ